MNTHKNIRYYRTLLGMTRKDLAEGICDTSTLFRIEKGEQTPRLDLLARICQKLKVPMDYIVSHICYIDLAKIEKYKRLCREFTYHNDYDSLQLVIEEFEAFITKYENQPEFSILERFIKWHKAIHLHEKGNNIMESEKLLKSIYISQLRTEMDIGICNSLGLVNLELYDTTYATNYFYRAYYALANLPLLNDNTLPPRIGYNLAYCYYYQGEMDKAISIAFKVLEHLETNQLSYMLGKTKHMLGKIFQRQNDLKQAEEHLTQALYLFHVESKIDYYNRVKEDLEDLKLKVVNSNSNHNGI
jgi:transcriptional regulator with XRE-family HTH domain